MTRIEKSDAQLDAEAAARENGLRWYIVDLRRAYWYEVQERLHGQQTTRTADLDAKGWPKDADEGGLGPPFSSWMHRYLRTNAGPDRDGWDRSPDPRTRLVDASIYAVSDWCHASHTSHQRPGYTLSLCAEMLSQVVKLGQEPEDLAWHFDLEQARVEHMLLGALRKAYQWRVDTDMRLSREPGTEAPLPERRPYRPAA